MHVNVSCVCAVCESFHEDIAEFTERQHVTVKDSHIFKYISSSESVPHPSWTFVQSGNGISRHRGFGQAASLASLLEFFWLLQWLLLSMPWQSLQEMKYVYYPLGNSDDLRFLVAFFKLETPVVRLRF